jgi:predicted nuclease of predicted toxin-antitoxin system
MLRLVSDENFNGEVVRGLFRRQPDLDLVRVQDVGLAGVDDPDVLEWAAREGRILLTHDRSTMPDFAAERVRAGLPMPGVFVVNDRLPTHWSLIDCPRRFAATEIVSSPAHTMGRQVRCEWYRPRLGWP